METGTPDNWPLLFAVAWIVGAWALSLCFPKKRPGPPSGKDGATEVGRGRGGARGSTYVRISYHFPANSKRNLAQLFDNTPEMRSLYTRAEFLLTFCGGFHPDQILHKWAVSPALKEERERFDEARRSDCARVIAQVRRNNLKGLYTPPEIPPEKPLALNFPLLPTEFSLFAGSRFTGSAGDSPQVVEQGIYLCKILEWREDDGYASQIELRSPEGRVLVVDQTSIIDALRLGKAAIEAIYFAGLPIYRFVARSRPLPPLAREQTVTQKLALKAPSMRDFQALDSKLLKIFGGVNPINLVRLSRFYHPKTGVKPDEAKYRKLVGRARVSGLAGRPSFANLIRLVPSRSS